MIQYYYETSFQLKNEFRYREWIHRAIEGYSKKLGTINYIFCDDSYLWKINKSYLNHDDFTDIISFDYSKGLNISGDIFISVERISENAKNFSVSFEKELTRVMAHGVLHFLGYKDKTLEEKKEMRKQENKMLEDFK